MNPSDDCQPLHYRSFVLRLWLEGDGGAWRLSLEDPHSAERIGFQDIHALAAYLEQWAAHACRSDC